MQQIAYIIIHFVDFALTVLQILMFVRAIISWFPIEEENALVNFLYAATEPLLEPVRNFLSRFSFFQRVPVDISFIVVFLLISVVQFLLSLLV